MRRLVLAALLLPALVGAPTVLADDAQPKAVFRGVSTAVQFDVSPPLRSIKPLPIVPGEDRDKFENRPTGLEGPLGPQDFDPLVQSQVGSGEIPAPLVSFNGPANISGVQPPDPVGDVGPNHYVAMSNLSFQVFSKTGTSLFGPALNNTLWAGFGGPCQTENSGDPIVLHDQLADRWILTQFTSAGPTWYNCVAISTTADPTGSYYRYAFSTGANFPDYPKYGVWPDALYISTREFAGGSSFAGVGAYAINRAQLVAGNPTPQVISFLATPAGSGGAFNVGDGLLPTDLDGNLLPPAGTPNFFLGSMDNGASYGATQDALTIWEFTADFTTPANSTFVLATTLPITPYDTVPVFCSGRACVPQPGTANKVDHLGYRQRPMHRAAYRNYGSHQSIVTNQSVEASATMSGIRWWEVRDPNGTPVVFQEGTYAPGTTDGIHRWMGSIAMDTVGNMALGYSASDATSVFPELRYTGRLAADPLGTMPQGEAAIVTGTGSQTSGERWGDYSSMNVDPVDDCTFWYVNEWLPVSGGNWQLRIGSFKFPDCALAPTFTLAVTPASQSICAPTSGVYTVNIGSVLGFVSPVTLSATGEPAGTTVAFSTNPVTPPGSSTLTIGNTGAATAGSYTINVAGVAAGPVNRDQDVALDVFTGNPGTPTLTAPANGAINQPATPTFTWGASSQGSTYTLEVATDAAFTNIVHTGSSIVGTTYSGATLNTNSTYFWRVRAGNTCGTGSNSAVFSFSTQAPPGECATGSTPNILFQDGFEAGAPGWTHSGTGDSWAIATANPHAGTSHFRAVDPDVVSDQRLVSPAVVVPTGQNPVTLSFWHVPNLENNGATACYDGGILEASTDGGANWAQVPNASLLVGPYTGAVSGAFSNPLGGLQAWCGGTAYINTIADVSAYAGQTVQFRLRLGSDTSVADVGWDVDDVKVQSCQPDSCPAVAKGDFNADSQVDLLFRHQTSNRNMAWLMNGTTRLSSAWITPDPAANQQIVGADDFNADNQSDLLFWNTSTGALEFWLMNGTGRTSAAPISGAPTLALNWKLAATGDFNADNQPDLVWRNTTSQKLIVWTLNGTTKVGNIVPSPDQAVNANWEVVAALDYNDDGNRDLLWYNYTSGKIVLWFMDASVVRINGTFTTPDAAGNNNWKVYAGGDYGLGTGGIGCSNDVVWRNATSGKAVVWFMDFAAARTAGEFTVPDAPTADPDGNPTAATDWIVAGPR